MCIRSSLVAGASGILCLFTSMAWGESPETPPPARPSPAPSTSVVEVEAETTPPEPSASSTSFVRLISLDAHPQPSAGLGALLELSPGITVQRLGGMGHFSTVLIRGASPGHVQVFLDGVPLTHPAQGAVNLEDLPLESIDRIELYRGGSPLAFGADAIGGVINLVSRPAAGGLEARSQLGVGSFGERWISGSVGGSLRGGPGGTQCGKGSPWRFRVSAGARSSQGNFPYYDDNGTDYTASDDQVLPLDNHDARLLEGSMRLERPLGAGGKLLLQGGLTTREQGVLALGRSTTAARYEAQQGSAFALFDLPPPADQNLRFTGQLDAFWRLETLDDPLGEITFTPTHSLNQALALGGLGHLQWFPSARNSVEVVGLARRETLVESTSGNGVGRARFGLGAQAEQRWLGLTVQPGLLLDYVQGSDTSQPLLASPRLGGKLELPSLRLLSTGPEQGLSLVPLLGANGGYFHRLPTFSELYGNQGSVVGNPDLAPERGLTADAGVKLELRHLGIDAPSLHLFLESVLFLQRIQDVILYVQNSQNTVKPQNISASETTGLELSLQGSWQERVSVTLGYTLLNAIDRSGIPSQDGLQLPGRPQHALNVLMSGSLVAGGMFPLTAFYRLNARTETALEPSHTLRNPGRALHDVGVTWTVGSRVPGLRLSIEARNLADTFYSPVEYVPTPQMVMDLLGFPLPGRSFFLQAEWKGSLRR